MVFAEGDRFDLVRQACLAAPVSEPGLSPLITLGSVRAQPSLVPCSNTVPKMLAIGQDEGAVLRKAYSSTSL